MSNLVQRNISVFRTISKVQAIPENAAVIVFSENEYLHFQGACQILILYGGLICGGRRLTPKTGLVPLFSAINAPVMKLESTPFDPDTLDIGCQVLASYDIQPIDRLCCVAVVRDFDVSLLKNSFDYRVSGRKRKKHPYFYLEANINLNSITKLNTVRFLLCDNFENQLYNIPESWDNLFELFSSGTEFKSAIIYGKKSTGKSTLSRYLVNNLIEQYGRIALLDCDAGQTELTPPGLVSLSVLSNPLLGLPDTNLITTTVDYQLCHFIGNTTPKNCPERYMRSILHLHSFYEHTQLDEFFVEGRKIPIIINTHGWVEGVGKDILNDLIFYLKPQYLLQMAEPIKKKYIEDGLIEKDGYNPVQCYVDAIKFEGAIAFPTPIEKRSTQLLNYFGLINYKLAEEGPMLFKSSSKTFKVPWKSVMLHFPDHNVPPSQTFYALNGSIVGLVVSNQNLVKYGTETNSSLGLSFLMSQLDPNESYAVGIGIVKIIDAKDQVFYISTSVPFESLKRVNTLVKSCLKIDSKLLLLETTLISPYLTSDSIPGEGSGSVEMKQRSNILRRRLVQ